MTEIKVLKGKAEVLQIGGKDFHIMKVEEITVEITEKKPEESEVAKILEKSRKKEEAD